jgi:hypothetical protein
MFNYKIFGDGHTRISIGNRSGQFFIPLPKDLANSLPNSTLLANEFLKKLKINKSADILEGKYNGSSVKPALFFREKYFLLRVIHGSNTAKAEKLSELATHDFEDQDIRAKYQQNVYSLIKAILSIYSKEDLRIVEDCLATGDTISGLLTLLKKKSKLIINRIRIDVLVGTTKGILLLREFAKSNKIEIELNIGYLAYCLSGNNYITYPENSKYQFVVGDMGDAAKSMDKEYDKDFSWNCWRKDLHGRRNKKEISSNNFFDHDKSTIIYLANGGYLMQAILKEIMGKKPDANEIMLSGKRVIDKIKGFGVLIDVLPLALLK